MIYQRMNKNEEENALNFKEKHFFSETWVCFSASAELVIIFRQSTVGKYAGSVLECSENGV